MEMIFDMLQSLQEPEKTVVQLLIILTSVIIWFVIFDLLFSRHKTSYMRNLPKVSYSLEEKKTFEDCYYSSKNIEMMLLVCGKKCKNRKMKQHIEAAIEYLKESRYQDYETALFLYASDGSDDMNRIFSELIMQEAKKNQRLPKFDRHYVKEQVIDWSDNT